jgi:hypothetical protein
MNLRTAATSVFSFILLAMVSGLISANVRKFADKHGWDNVLVRSTEKLRWERVRGLWWFWSIFGVSGGVALVLWVTPLVGVSPAFVATNNLLTADSPNYVGSPLGIRWESANLVVVQPGLIYGFRIDTKNVGKEELTLKNSYLISGIDRTKLSMLVSTPPLSEISPEGAVVPLNTMIVFPARFNNLPEMEFFKKWENFSIVIQYNDSKERHEFNRQWVIDQVKESHPESRPHVSKRPS